MIEQYLRISLFCIFILTNEKAKVILFIKLYKENPVNIKKWLFNSDPNFNFSKPNY